MKNLIQSLGGWILPHICCLCAEKTGTARDLCSVCQATLPWVEDRCYRCGLRMEEKDQKLAICEACSENPPIFDRLCSLFSYDEPVTELITGLKFSKQLAFGRILGDILADAVLNEWYTDTPLPQAIIPMPLHHQRLKKRGYNQALELIWPTIKRSKIILLNENVQRVRDTRPQSNLNAEQRMQNMKGAFEVCNPLNIQHVAVIDDVVTTGNTVKALSSTLKENGILHIDIWCICRA